MAMKWCVDYGILSNEEAKKIIKILENKGVCLYYIIITY